MDLDHAAGFTGEKALRTLQLSRSPT